LNVVLLCLLSLVANAQDHLEPNNGLFEEYEFRLEYFSQIREILFDGLSEQPYAQMVIIPSFSKELVWQLNEEGGKYVSVLSTPNHSIWYNQYEKKPKTLKNEISKNEISYESAKLIKELYWAALNTVRYGEDRQGFDGVSYYFSTISEVQKSGAIWTPKEGSKMKKLVDVSQSIITETQKKAKLSDDLTLRIRELILELK
ncbi:MAG: hypothetical protein RLO12_10175, partial [Fulvivirga sp.]